MKAKIHPTYHPASEVSCVCGNTFTIGSTKDKFEVDICYNCHPFYTGKSKVVDTAGRIEKFKSRHAAKATTTEKKVRVSKNKKTA